MTSTPLPSLQNFATLAKQRRTLKPADMDPERDIPRDVVEHLLECATWAPTHGMTEPWQFHVFSGEGRRHLAQFLSDLYPQITPSEEQRPEKLAKLSSQPLLSPIVIAVGVKIGTKIPATEEIQAVACATQNLWLAATTLGLGLSWSSPPVSTHEKFVEWLGLSSHDACLGLLYLGWPKNPQKYQAVMGARKSVSEKSVWRME